jgi:hypothetical protein
MLIINNYGFDVKIKMNAFRYIIINILLVASISLILQSQENSNRKRYTEVKYILRDSTGSYVIRETTSPDGTKNYNLVPKSSPYDTIGAIRTIPERVNDWFYRGKKTNGIALTPIQRKQDSLDYSLNYYEKSDTTGAANAKDNDGAWWIIGTTTVISGIIAYIFLQYKKPLDELPIQPDPPKY